MAHLKACPNWPILSTKFHKYPPLNSSVSTATVGSAHTKPECGRGVGWLEESRQKGKNVIRTGKKRRVSLVCRSSNPSSAGGVGVVGEEGKGQFGCLVSAFGWRVKRLVEEEDEMRRVAHVQGEAFHEPVAIFNDFFFQFFQAEVLAALIYKLRNSPPNRYACLVAEPMDDFNSLQHSQKGLVGVVDVTVMRDEAVLRHLDGAEEYLYVSGIAVLPDFRH